MKQIDAPNGTHHFLVFENLVLVVRVDRVLLTLTPEDFEIVYRAEREAETARQLLARFTPAP